VRDAIEDRTYRAGQVHPWGIAEVSAPIGHPPDVGQHRPERARIGDEIARGEVVMKEKIHAR